MKAIWTGVFLIGSLTLSAPAFAFQSIYIVRHAEKRDATSKDPELSVDGQARAANLAKALRDSEISAIYTSEYQRTLKTAAPLAEHLKIKPTAINDTAKLIKSLQDDTSAKAALVVGHSNTVPDIIKAFGGEQTIQLGENDYDRLYILTPQKAGKPVLNLIRY